jgi:hypothetical protein
MKLKIKKLRGKKIQEKITLKNPVKYKQQTRSDKYARKSEVVKKITNEERNWLFRDFL